MAAPTPTTYTEWNGTAGMTYWNAVWTDGTNLTDSIVVNISDLGAPTPNSVKVTGVKAQLNGDISATVEFDATTDQLIYRFQNQSDATLIDVTDFREGPSSGRSPSPSAAGFTGDILVTTTNVASGDELTLLIFYKRKT